MPTKPTFDNSVAGSGGGAGVTLSSPAAFAPSQVQNGVGCEGAIAGTPAMPCGGAPTLGSGQPMKTDIGNAGGLGNKWSGEKGAAAPAA